MKKIIRLLLAFFCTCLHATSHPQLIVQIVVDQLRGDLLQEYQEHFAQDGFNYLLNHSVQFNNAHHPQANTVTCVGHATIATGAYPEFHGIVANEWFDSKTKRIVYCTEDLNSKIINSGHGSTEGAGRSPRQLLSSTFSDELVLAKKGRAFAVALKDRSAITLGGHAGIAYWYDRENGGFVSSQYYMQHYPAWVNDWNKQYILKKEIWQLSRPRSEYLYQDAPTFANRFPAFGSHFPHNTGEPGNEHYFKFLSMTPVADELTADFAITLVQHEQLGKNPGKTDYLAVSFAATDTIGHQFGPNSLESEDNLLHLDATLAKLFKVIDEQVGLDKTLIILTADHGVSDSFAYLQAHRMPMTPAFNEKAVRLSLDNLLYKKFHLPSNVIAAIELPYIYLDHSIIQQQKVPLLAVKGAIIHSLNQRPEVYRAYALDKTTNAKDWLGRKVNRMAYLKRAGDIYIVPSPFQYPDETQEQRVCHGTPWNYDSYVPLLFANSTWAAKVVSRPAWTTDIAPTLSALLAIKPTSAAVGKPLSEVLATY